MRKWLFSIVFFCCAGNLWSQGLTYRTSIVRTGPGIDINFSDPDPTFEPKLILVDPAYPQPASGTAQLRLQLDKQRQQWISEHPQSNTFSKKGSAPAPQIEQTFAGNVTQGTPNDNDLAISENGFLMSASNTNYVVYNDTGKLLKVRSLAAIALQLGTLNRTFDPRVIYDHEHRRFIAVFLQGSTHADTRIITGFSTTSDPTGTWKFYAIPGNLTGDSSWSDYPIITITKTELFITVNRVKDNTPWQTGFIESLIWQTELADGYAGDTLTQKVYHDIKYNGVPIWSICPAKGARQYGPNQYFISLRPSALSNDTVFLHEITNTLASGQAQLKLKVLKSDNPYGLPPNAFQPGGQRLQTNDARALCAFYEDEKIQFVGNSIHQPTFSPGIYHGVVDHITSTPTVHGKTFGYDTMDIGYPSIAHAGSIGDNNSAMLTFSYASSTRFPGTLALFSDRDGQYSDPVIIRTGETYIDLLTDTIERWGDYTGLQRHPNNLRDFYLNGSYGINKNNSTWIGHVTNTDPRLSSELQTRTMATATVYPNPAREQVTVEFEVAQPVWLTFSITDSQGRKVADLLHDKAKPGKNAFKIFTDGLTAGVYYINITDNDKIQLSRKILVGGN